MTPSGMTNVTIGVVWAWHALTPGEPFTQAQAVRPDVDKVMILLTDGLNTANRFTTNPIADRHPHRGGLRQHQEGQDQAVHRAGDRGKR